MSNEVINATFSEHHIVADYKDNAATLYDKSRYGEPKKKKITYSLVEGLYLVETGKMIILDGRNKEIDEEKLIKKSKKIEPNFWTRYCVYKDMRKRGYILKTALKFGADFRVYERGVKPGEDHAKWILYPVHESEMMTWFDFSAKNRVAHSTRKNLLLGVVDDEGDVTYYEIRWLKP